MATCSPDKVQSWHLRGYPHDCVIVSNACSWSRVQNNSESEILSDVTIKVFFIIWVEIVLSFASTNYMFCYYYLYYIIFNVISFQGKWPISPVQIDNNTNTFNYNANTFSVHNISSQTLFTWVVLLKVSIIILRIPHLFFLVSNSKLKIIASEKGTTVFIQLIINIAQTFIWVTQHFNLSKTILCMFISDPLENSA